MSDQSKPTTGEWTAVNGDLNTGITEIFPLGRHRAKTIADAHNAALAAERTSAEQAQKPLVAELQNIVNCDLAGMREDFGDDTDRQFRLWAQNRAKAALAKGEGIDPEALARRFHDLYEKLAPNFGYVTREDTRAFDPTTPNGKLMIAVCSEL